MHRLARKIQFSTVFLMLMLAVAIIPIAQGIHTLRSAGVSLQWKAATGSVISAGIDENSDGDSTTYTPVVTYEYAVDSTSYVGSRLTFAAVGTTHEKAKARLDRYPVGLKTVVYYDPSNPAQSVLEPGMTVNSWTTLAAGMLLATFTVSAYTALRIAGRRGSRNRS